MGTPEPKGKPLRAYYSAVLDRAKSDAKDDLDRVALISGGVVFVLGGGATAVLAGEVSWEAAVGGLAGFILYGLFLYGRRLLQAPLRLAEIDRRALLEAREAHLRTQEAFAQREKQLAEKHSAEQRCESLTSMLAAGELIMTKIQLLDHATDEQSDPFGYKLSKDFEDWQEAAGETLKNFFPSRDYTDFHSKTGLQKPSFGGNVPQALEFLAEILNYRLLRLREIIERHCR